MLVKLAIRRQWTDAITQVLAVQDEELIDLHSTQTKQQGPMSIFHTERGIVIAFGSNKTPCLLHVACRANASSHEWTYARRRVVATLPSNQMPPFHIELT